MNKDYYEEKLKTLPENLQYAVEMSDWSDKLIDIQNKFKLHIDQTQVLETSVIKLMFGDMDAPDFIATMFNEGHVNSETAADILLEVDLKILKNIRDRLELIDQSKDDDKLADYFLLDDEKKEELEENENFAKYYAEIEKIREEDDSEPDEIEETEIPTDIDQEKIDLLKEIEQPTKAPTTISLNTNIPTKTETQEEPIKPDHQLENKEIEKPYHEDTVIKQTETTSTAPEPKKPTTIKLNDIYREPIE